MIFTIGHSNHTPERLVELLREHGIEAVVDVRSAPYSKYSPHFNRERLARLLAAEDIRYAFMGDSLGGRPDGDEFYDEHGHVLYGPLSRSAKFVEGIATLERNAERYRLALLCSEADPTACHRFLLVTRTLRERGFDPASIEHILGDGSLRPETKLAFQGNMLEDSWRSPLSVSPSRAPSHSSIA
ncbi:MAG: DUF488 domain-containing protein [Chloroflexi bacterium]|nr:DUF488 domain-containing protein [Chloroflexota bacterium]